MTRIVVTYDELRKKYKLVTGNVRADIHTKKTEFLRLAGQSIILDFQTPVNYSHSLVLGQLVGSFRLKITALDGKDIRITENESIMLNRLFYDSADLIKFAYESFVSHLKVNLVQRKQETLYLNNLVSEVFPKITTAINQELFNALGNINSVVFVELNAYTNNSAGVDQYSSEEKQYRNDLIGKMLELVKESPYPPETFSDTVNQLMSEVDKQNPEKISPDPKDVQKALMLIDGYRATYRSHLLLGSNGNTYQLPPRG